MNFFRQARALLMPALLPAVLALALLGLTPTAHGQIVDITEAGAGSSLNTNTSWTPNTVPSAADLGIFKIGSNTGTSTFSTALTLGGLQILNPAGAITINASTAGVVFNLGNTSFSNGGGIDMSNATVGLTLGTNNTLTLANAQTWIIGNTSTHPGLTVNSPITNGGFALTVIGTSPVTFGGVISGSGILNLDTSNTTTLSANNTMTGGVSLQNGTLFLSVNGTNSSGSSLGTGALTIAGGSSGVTLNTSGGIISFAGSTNNALNLDSNLTFTGSNNLNFGTGLVTLGTANAVLAVNGASTLTLGGIISGVGDSITETTTGTGNLSLTGVNTFSGNFNLQSGTLTVATNALENATLNYTGGTFTYSALTNITLGGLAGSVNLAVPSVNMTIATGNYTSANYTGVLSGGGAVIISGTGTETFSGANTYTGTTNLTGGTLVLNNVGTSASNSAIGTATLNITGGTLDAGSAMNSGAALATHNAVTLDGNFTFAGSNNLNLGTGLVSLAVGNEVINVANDTLTLGGIISGTGNILTKAGAGTLVLTGLNTYSGGTNVLGGTLNLDFVANNTANITNGTTGGLTLGGGQLSITGDSGSTNSNTQAFASTTINAGNNSIVGSMALGNATGLLIQLGGITRAAGGTLAVTLPTVGAVNTSLTIAGNTTSGVVTSTGKIAYMTVGGTDWAALTTGTGNITAATYSTAAQTTWTASNALNENIQSTTDTLTANRQLNTIMFNGTADTLNLSTSTLTINAGGILLSSNATGGATIEGGINGNLTGQASANDELVIIVNNSTAADGLTISANIVNNNANATIVTKSGAGELTLSGANNYTGKTYLNAGTLVIGTNGTASSGALGATAGTFVINGGTVDSQSGVTTTITANNAQTWNGNFTFAGSGNLNMGTGLVALGANVALNATASTLTVGGIISGGFSVAKAGSGGSLVLNGVNTFTGGVTLNAGTLDLNQGGTTSGSSLGTGTFTINGGNIDNTNATLAIATNNTEVWNSGFTFVGTNNLNMGTGNVTLGSSAIVTLSSATNALTLGGNINDNGYNFGLTGLGSATINGVISGGGPLYLNSTGTTTLGGNNTISGGINLLGGTLDITNNGTPSASSLGTGTLNIFGGASGVTLDAGASLITLATNNNVNLSSNLTFTGTHSLNLGTGVVILGTSNATVTVNANTLTIGGTIVDGGALNFSNADSLTKAGASGYLALNGTNTFSGNFNLAAGTVLLNNSLALQNATLNDTSAATNAVSYGGGITNITVAGLAGTANLALPTVNITIATSPFNNANYSTAYNTANYFGVANYSGVLSGSGNVIISGSGTEMFSGQNTYTGATNLTAGTLILNNVGSATTGSAIGKGGVLNITGGTLDAGALMTSALATNNNSTIGGTGFTFAGSNNLNLGTGNVTLITTPTITISGNTLTLGGVISGAFGLTLNGSGTLALTNASSNYSGATVINGGTLQVTTLALSTVISSIGNSTSADSNLNINGGTLQLLSASATPQTTDREIAIGNSATDTSIINATLDASAAPANVTDVVTWSNTSTNALTINTTASANLILTGNSGTTTTFNILDGNITNNGTSGTTSVIKNGSGEWSLNGTDNTYTGGMTVNAGTLGIDNNTALGTGTLTLNNVGGTNGTSLDNTSGATLTLSSALAQDWNGNWTFVGTQALNMNTGAVTLGANLTLTSASTLTVGGTISDGGQGYSLTKSGAGTLVLTGTNTFSGNLNLTQGTLTASGLSLQNATLDYGTAGTTFNFAAGTTTGNLGGLEGNQSFTGPTTSLTINTSEITPTSNGSTAVAGYTFANLSYSGVITGGAMSLSMNGNGTEAFSGANSYSGATTLNGGTIAINANGTATTSPIGNGTLTFDNGNIDNSSGSNVTLATNNHISINDNFTFEGTNNLNLGTGAVTLGAQSAYVITLGGQTLTIGGNIGVTADSIQLETILGSKTGPLVGTGTLVLSGNNSYSGGTNVTAGWLDINNGVLSNTTASAIGSGQLVLDGGNIDNTSGGVVTLGTNNSQIWEKSFTFGGTDGLNLGTGTVTLSNAPTISITGNTLTAGGVVSGGTGFTLNGQGTLALTNAANTFNGAIVLNGGTLSVTTVGNSGANSGLGNTTSLTFNGGTLQLISSTAGQMGTTRLFTIDANGATLDASDGGTATDVVKWSNTSALTIGESATNTTLTLTGNSGNSSNATSFNTFDPLLADNGSAHLSVIKSGSGDWALNNNNTYSGGTFVNSGTLDILANGTTTTNSAIGTGTLYLNGGNIDTLNAGTVSLAGSTNNAEVWNSNFTFVGSGNLNMGTGAVTMNAPITLNVSGNTLTIGGSITDNGNGYTFTKTGLGTLSLTNSTLLQDSTISFSTGNGTLTLGASTATFGGLSGNGAITGPATLTLNPAFFFNNNFNGTLSGTSSLTLGGSGIQEFSGANTYTGTTTLNGGTLEIGSIGALGTSNLTISGGNLDGAGFAITNNLTLSNNFTYVGTGSLSQGTGTVTLSQNEVINVANNTLTLGGVIQTTTNSLTKTGAGTLVLTNTSNAYSGGTVISGGTLSLLFGTAGTNDIISNNTALTLNGGTLSMSGVAGGSNTQTFSGTTIGAGAASASQALSAGTLTMNFGNFTRSAGGTLNVAPSTVAASNFTGNINTQLTSSVITSGHVAYLTVNGTNWATLTGGNATAGNITALTSNATANGSWLSTVNDLITTQAITMNTGSVSNESLNSLVFNGAASSIALNGGTLTMTTGGILANATGADTISGGNLTASNGELVLIVNSALPANNLSISGNIVGAIAVTKSGTGNLSLTGTLSNYSGGTYLNQGTLSLGNAAALGTGTLNINGGTLDASSALAVTNAQNWNGNWTFGGSSALTLGNSSNTTALGANVTLTTAGNTLTIAGAITDASAFYLTKAGNTGTLALNGTNTFTGGLILSAGTLDINSATALGGTASVFTINSNATSNTTIDNTNTALTVTNHNAQIWNGNFTFTGTNNLDLGTGAVALGANDTITVIGHTLSIDGNIGGSTTSGASSNTLPSQFGLTLGNGTAGSGGTLALTGNNNYNGGTTVTNGTLVLSGNNIGTGNTTLSGVNSVLDINQGGNSTASALGTGTLVIGALSTIDNTNASLTVMTNNAVNINGNFTFTGTHSLGLGTGNITLGTATPNITVTANTLTLGGAISDATGTAWGLTKVGAGTLDLGGNNTYTGATAVNAGTLELSGTTGNNALGINALGTTVNSGATLQLDNGYITGGSTGSSSTGSLLTLNGAGNISATDGGALLNNGTTQWNGNIALATSATISAGTGAAGVLTLGNLTALLNYQDYGNISNISINSNTLTFTGAPGSLISVDANITGNGGSIVVNSGVEVYLNAPNDSYSGNTTVLNGTLGIDGVTPGADVTAGQGNLSVPGNIIIGSGSGTATDANLTYFDGGSGNLINDMASVTIKADGVFDLAGVEQMIGNLSMTGGCITLGTGGTLDTNGNASITISANTDASLISQGRFNLGNSAGTTTTPISVATGANFTISSRLTGGNFIQSGDGTMSLINQAVGGLLQNTFTGFAEIQGGTLVITASNALGTSDNLVGDGTKVDAGAQLQLTQTTGNLAVAVPNELLTLNGSGPAGAGALQSVNGTNSWAGSVIVNSSATVNTTTGSLTFAPTGGGTGTFSSNISSSTGATLTFIGAGNTTISTPLAGASNNLNLYSNMSTGSTLLISNISTNNTYSGTTTVNNGILELQGHTTAGGTNLIANSNNLTINTHGTLLTDTNNTLGPSVNMVLNGGTWETNAANAGGTGLTAFSSTTTTLSANGKATAQATFAETLNTLTLTGTSNITLGSGSNIINFAASNGVNWTPGQVLYINNWNGTFATSISANYTDGLIGGGGTDQIIFDGGGNYAGLDGSAYTGQLGEIVFVNPQDAALGFNGATGDFNAVITNDGEVVPFVTVPEPGTLAAGAALGGLALLREWRRRKNRAAPAIVS